jgi:hypothetical protein
MKDSTVWSERVNGWRKRVVRDIAITHIITLYHNRTAYGIKNSGVFFSNNVGRSKPVTNKDLS